MMKQVQKEELESSSEEEDLETDGIYSSLLKIYASIGGKIEDLGRTQSVLENTFQSGAAVCLICIALVKRTDSIWNCDSCYAFFHLNCIKRWAKDSVSHQRNSAEEKKKKIDIFWNCPKCRKEYDSNNIPDRYDCFCCKTSDPEFHPWLVPHSCGEMCGKPLLPECGHSCLLLCHPGPCPPCPKMVKSNCFCGRSDPVQIRCSKKEWSCDKICSKKLSCKKHGCTEKCHKGECPPCKETSLVSCLCGEQKKIIACAEPKWKCNKVCGKPLSCGQHKCEIICHKEDCGPCPRAMPRSCPCGKDVAVLECTEEFTTCGDTCSKLLDCGLHACSMRCHKGPCGPCVMVSEKSCRCGIHKKEIPCSNEYLCDVKCKLYRDCGIHHCNRKCCDRQCPPCYTICKRNLNCGKHKCESVCHRGPCYPCQQTQVLTCKKCSTPIITIPCSAVSRKRYTCPKTCLNPPDCHHKSRITHKCHTGSCPPCSQTCEMLKPCGHVCNLRCHTFIGDVTRSKRVDKPCPKCTEIVKIVCLGGHEEFEIPCHESKDISCGRDCGRELSCGKHICGIPCHVVLNAPDEILAGTNCDECREDCEVESNCGHPCPLRCHSEPCPPCQVNLKLKCHCQLNIIYVKCNEWNNFNQDERIIKQSCGNICPKLYPCGHRCCNNCHTGPCIGAEQCKKRIKILCPCKRIKKMVPCYTSSNAKIDCDSTCESIKKEIALKESEAKRAAELKEEMKKKEELEMYEKKLSGKKYRSRRRGGKDDAQSHSKGFLYHYRYLLITAFVLVVSVGSYLALN